MNPRYPFYDSEQQAYYFVSSSGRRTYYDPVSGNEFQIDGNGFRRYYDENSRRFYYLDSNGGRIYSGTSDQPSHQQTPGDGQQAPYLAQLYGGSATEHGQYSMSNGPMANLASTSQRIQPPSDNNHSYYDRRSGVQTMYKTGPAQEITEPGAYSRGVEAAKLLPGTTTGYAEAPDPSYSMKNRAYFIVGRVFEILWAEPLGATNGAAASIITQDSQLEDKYFLKRRKFIVVLPGQGHCSALAIFTYDGKGVSKPSVRKSDHAIVYDGRLKDDPPKPLLGERPQRGEDPMRPQMIRLDLNNRERWHSTSRVNLSKTYTIEHNVKVRDIGMINPRSVTELVTLYWQIIWENTNSADPRYAAKYAGVMDAFRRARSDSATGG